MKALARFPRAAREMCARSDAAETGRPLLWAVPISMESSRARFSWYSVSLVSVRCLIWDAWLLRRCIMKSCCEMRSCESCCCTWTKDCVCAGGAGTCWLNCCQSLGYMPYMFMGCDEYCIWSLGQP